ncbi:MAG: DUF421 domain-containing protein [Verrucomicrobiales bacterium]|nr:DUF421 domain-containing protein [Verrucomicrobiales bacterium]
MIDSITSAITALLGLDLKGEDLGVWHMTARGVVVFIVAITLIRIGDKRFMGRNTALDVMLGFVFGSVMSRAITGNSPFFPTLAAGTVLVVMHWLLSFIAFHSDRFGTMVKGDRRLLIDGGEINWKEMKHSHISRNDLDQAIRSSGHQPDIEKIESAILERNGDISVIPKSADLDS